MAHGIVEIVAESSLDDTQVEGWNPAVTSLDFCRVKKYMHSKVFEERGFANPNLMVSQ